MAIIKAYAILDIDGTILGGSCYASPEIAQSVIDSMSYLGEMLEVTEIDFNDERYTDVGEEYIEKLEQYRKESGLINFHMSFKPSFYLMSADDRIKFIYETLTVSR